MSGIDGWNYHFEITAIDAKGRHLLVGYKVNPVYSVMIGDHPALELPLSVSFSSSQVSNRGSDAADRATRLLFEAVLLPQ